MKKAVLVLVGSVSFCYAQEGVNSVFENIKSTTENVNEAVTNITELARDNKEKNGGQTSNETNIQPEGIKSTKTDTGKLVLKAYQNYDFVAGEKILFEDDFLKDMEGEFPAHWDLTNGQAVVNKQTGKTCFLLIDGGYCRVNPLVKTKTYLGSEFTLEFDYFPTEGAYGVMIGFFDADGQEGSLSFSREGISGTFGDKFLAGMYPSTYENSDYFGKWHHVAIAYKNNQLKGYVDVNRVLTMPNVGMQPVSMDFHGLASQDNPIVFTNVKIADGGKMNMLDKIMTNGKIVTHGILFDVNKASIKPESMGVVNQIFQLLKDNAELKFEIGGYTDSDGDDNANLKLSEQRAIAVKEQLISMGISGERLSTKGYGEASPIDVNTTSEGKANNRRVEFLKR